MTAWVSLLYFHVSDWLILKVLIFAIFQNFSTSDAQASIRCQSSHNHLDTQSGIWRAPPWQHFEVKNYKPLCKVYIWVGIMIELLIKAIDVELTLSIGLIDSNMPSLYLGYKGELLMLARKGGTRKHHRNAFSVFHSYGQAYCNYLH